MNAIDIDVTIPVTVCGVDIPTDYHVSISVGGTGVLTRRFDIDGVVSEEKMGIWYQAVAPGTRRVTYRPPTPDESEDRHWAPDPLDDAIYTQLEQVLAEVTE